MSPSNRILSAHQSKCSDSAQWCNGMENICHRVKWVVVTKRVFWRFFNHKQALFILLLLLKWGQTKKDIISNEKEKPSAVSESYQSMRLSLCRLCDMQHVQQSLHFLWIFTNWVLHLQFQMFSFNVNRKINSFLCYLQLVRK